jgi:sugar phosphate isomerase/epimerase
MIEFACHTWAFNDLTLAEALGTIARLGFRYADIGSGPNLNAANAARSPRRAAADIREDLETFNLKLSDLYIMLPRVSLPEDDRREKDVDLFKSLVPFAAALEAPGMTVSPGLAQTDEGAFGRTAASLKAMVEAAHAEGIAVSIEPHMDSMAQTPDAALALVEAVPGLKITLDPAHFVYQNLPYDTILKLMPHVRHVQLRQAMRGRLQTTFERGKVDLARILNDLQTASYAGVVCVEYMIMPGWHGMMKVDAIRESATMRDTLREIRDKKS